MTNKFERMALILLAGTALTAMPTVGLAQATLTPDTAAPSAPSAEEAPTEAFAAPGVDAAARAKSRRPASSYTVRRGDTLAEVATKLGSDVEELAKINGLKRPYRLNPGDVIKGPRAAPAPDKSFGAKGSAKASGKSAPAETYTVRSGDTLFSIAQKNGTTVEALRAANGLGRSSSISAGRKLRLSGGREVEVAEEPAEPVAKGRRGARAEIEPPTPGRSVPGRVITIETPGKAYVVRRGDTLERVAGKLNGDIADLARINKLKRPYRLRPGPTIHAAGGTAKAYVVARGDTLAEIARRFGVSSEQLRLTNGLRRGAAVAPGRKLRLPDGYRDHGPIAPIVREHEVEATPPVRNTPPERPIERIPEREAAQPGPSEALPTAPQPYNGRPTPPPSRPYQPPRVYTPPPSGPISGAPTASPQVSDAQIMQLGRGLFAWPIRGEVLSGFGGKGNGQRNDGLNIRANTGDAVRAAAGGDVVYAGDQVPGFGNLVLIKHADGWVTAYGHLSKVNVRMQQKVSQGEQIGEAGSSGGVPEPQLHFEVRYAPTPQERARPVDPALVLPR